MFSALQACFQTAVDYGLDISLSPHLDDGLGEGACLLQMIFSAPDAADPFRCEVTS